jgi:hypothetical protein
VSQVNCNNFWLGYTQGPAVTPRLYEIMQSLVGTPDGSTNPYELAATARALIFDFDYDLHQETKQAFETNILDYFMMRRLGYETYTLWHIKFKNRILTILPKYNALFDYQARAFALIEADINGKSYTIDHVYGSTNTNTKNLNDALTHGLVSESVGTLDSRQSDTPQNNIDEVKSGQYLSNYNFDQSGNTVTNRGTDTTAHTGTDTTAHTGTDTDRYSESLASPEKLELLAKYQASIQNIYTQIYKELDSLFSIF